MLWVSLPRYLILHRLALRTRKHTHTKQAGLACTEEVPPIRNLLLCFVSPVRQTRNRASEDRNGSPAVHSAPPPTFRQG